MAGRRWSRIAAAGVSAGRDLGPISDDELRERFRACRAVRARGTAAVARLLGLLIEARRRSGEREPTRDELVAAVAILDRGAAPLGDPNSRAVAAGLAAGTAAALGRHVHVLAHDENRASAMAGAARGMFDRVGIEAGLLQASARPRARRASLGQPVVFAAAHRMAREYLASAISHDPALSPTLRSIAAIARTPHEAGGPRAVVTDFAIVDTMEALLCEGGTARVFAATHPATSGSSLLEQAYGLADELVEERDFVRTAAGARLTSAGNLRIGLLGRVLGPPWQPLSFDRQLQLVHSALDARTLDDRDFEVVDGTIMPRTDRARSLFSAAAGDDPSVVDFVAARVGLTGASRPAATRISIGRFVGKYRRLGGTVAPGGFAAAELAGRFALLPGRGNRPPEARIGIAGSELEADRRLASKVRAALASGASALVMVADPDRIDGAEAKLAAAGIQANRLAGTPSEADADLVATALTGGSCVVLLGPARNVARMRDLRGLGGQRPHLILVGIETAGVMPEALISHLPLREFEPQIDVIANVHHGHFARHLYRVERALLGWLARSDGGTAQVAIGLLLRSAFRRAARQRRRARAAAYRLEHQQIAALAFVGAATERL